MREIKFRGKSIEEYLTDYEKGAWVYGSLLHGIHGKTYIHFLSKGRVKMVDVDPETVGQFTELKDRNGKDIYEGDVVRMKSLTSPDYEMYQVMFVDGMFCAYRINGLYYDSLHYLIDVCEIIGNVHDNPELIANNK